MRRREFCLLGALGLAVAPGAAMARPDGAHQAFSTIGRAMRRHLDAQTLDGLFKLARDNGWMTGALPQIDRHGDRIGADFRADRVVKVNGVHFSQTEAAMILGCTQAAA